MTKPIARHSTLFLLVETPNCLDINSKHYRISILIFSLLADQKYNLNFFDSRLLFEKNNYEPLGLLITGCMCYIIIYIGKVNLLNLTNIVKHV